MSGMIITVFRSRLSPDGQDDYHHLQPRMVELARSMPGFVSVKSFTADDGERVTIVEFDSEEHQRAWAEHPEHREAQRRGRLEFYADYDLKVATVTRHSRFPHPDRIQP